MDETTTSGTITIFVGGTYSASREECNAIFGLPEKYSHGSLGQRIALEWKGGNSSASRNDAVMRLREEVEKHFRLNMEYPNEIQALNIIGFSHGGNIGLELISEYQYSRLKCKLVTIATPECQQYSDIAKRLSARVKWLNLYSPRDWIQKKLSLIGPIMRGKIYGSKYCQHVDIDNHEKNRIAIHKYLPSSQAAVSRVERFIGGKDV